jgi:hypothetical protein
VRDVFSAESPPLIESLADLRKLLQLSPPSAAVEVGPGAGVLATMDSYYAANYFAALGQSTALSGHVVSTINPRPIVINDASLTAFQRGVPRVELATVARDNGDGCDFYLLSFTRPLRHDCDRLLSGRADTTRLESDWTSTQLDDEDLKDTERADARIELPRAALGAVPGSETTRPRRARSAARVSETRSTTERRERTARTGSATRHGRRRNDTDS